MSMREAAFVAFLMLITPAAAAGPGLGEPLATSDIPFFATYVLPDGSGLPAGHGDATEGMAIWAESCAACHGATGREGPIQPVVGPAEDYPKPAGQYWPYASTLFDYIRRAMPFHSPKSLSDDEIYAVTAYILSRNGLISSDEVIDSNTLPQLEMPNRRSFIDHWSEAGEVPY